ncbi:MAG: MoxR family ATPase, partial [Oscillospiraceae bacterium]|nr:MoxR family ATPase [Oscillospiraceae bacterium]
LFLADELNRATSRTQSALLEAMEEGQVTVDGVSHRLPEPFIVFATQNPVGSAGTQLLPDSQMDRFSIRLSVGYPSAEAEFEMVQNRLAGNPVDSIEQVMTCRQFIEERCKVSGVYVSGEVIRYIIALVGATRNSHDFLRGASPRATLSVTQTARAVAFLRGRDFVVPEDVAAVFEKVVTHRVSLSAEAEEAGGTVSGALRRIVRKTPAPRV